MSVQLIQQYHAKVEKIIRYGGSRNESSVRKPFQDLLEQYARQRNLELIGELEYRTRRGHTVYPDGTLKDALRQDWGYWESKDEKDDLESEIAAKFAKGYPANNILFEDTQTAVLYQAGEEAGRVNFRDAAALDALLTRFVSYENDEVRHFRCNAKVTPNALWRLDQFSLVNAAIGRAKLVQSTLIGFAKNKRCVSPIRCIIVP